MSKYDKLKQRNTIQRTEEKPKLDLAVRASEEMAKDARRTAEVYRNAGEILDDIDARFEKATGLNGTDVAFLMLATALQVGRWVVIGMIHSTIDAKLDNLDKIERVEHDDKSIRDMEKQEREFFRAKHEKNEIVKTEGHRDWMNIVFNGVPYDVTRGSSNFGIKMEGRYHRLHTLGHDPVLGWIFGTINILSDTITLDKKYFFRTFDVCMEPGHKKWVSKCSLHNAIKSAFESVKEDKNRLPAAIFAQGLHLKSDMFTKLGLPVPLLEAFAPDKAGKLYEEGYDTLQMLIDHKKELKVANDVFAIGFQTAIAVLINLVISLIHGLFYDPNKHISRDLYEVKTRKILSISNLIASSSNVIWVGANAYFGNENAWKYLDIGGIAVTLHRLISDTQFIRQVKSEFLEKEWQNAVLGEEYSFLEEAKKYGP